MKLALRRKVAGYFERRGSYARLRRTEPDPREVLVPRIEQPVRLAGIDGGGDAKDDCLRLIDERGTDVLQACRGWKRSPVLRQGRCLKSDAANGSGNVGPHNNQVVRRVQAFDVDEVFEHSE